MMHLENNLMYKDDKDCQVLALPYGNGAYQMTILLPHEGKTVNEVLQGMTAEKWKQYKWMDEAVVDVKLPRFESMTELNLNDIMSELGMPNAFVYGIAEFPDFCNKEDIYISLMKQVAKIEVNEAGTEAAAVTIIGVKDSAGPEEPLHVKFHANRPFLYIISEQSTGSIFFIGQYMGNQKGDPAGIAPSSLDTPSSTKIYNLAGQQLSSPPAKGIYIRDGKKMVAP